VPLSVDVSAQAGEAINQADDRRSIHDHGVPAIEARFFGR